MICRLLFLRHSLKEYFVYSQPGDKIYGSIEKTALATWRIDGAFKATDGTWQNTTLVSEVGAFNYNYADVTLVR